MVCGCVPRYSAGACEAIARGFVRREEERDEKMEITISDSCGKKKARIRMSLGDDAQGRRIA